jgi:2-oxoglutarate ferredoxin oxidoreductase subunit delta
LARINIEKETCKGCELCVHFCPKACIEMAEGFNLRGFRFSLFTGEDKCTGCALCARICPDVAIEVWK